MARPREGLGTHVCAVRLLSFRLLPLLQWVIIGVSVCASLQYPLLALNRLCTTAVRSRRLFSQFLDVFSTLSVVHVLGGYRTAVLCLGAYTGLSQLLLPCCSFKPFSDLTDATTSSSRPWPYSCKRPRPLPPSSSGSMSPSRPSTGSAARPTRASHSPRPLLRPFFATSVPRPTCTRTASEMASTPTSPPPAILSIPVRVPVSPPFLEVFTAAHTPVFRSQTFGIIVTLSKVRSRYDISTSPPSYRSAPPDRLPLCLPPPPRAIMASY